MTKNNLKIKKIRSIDFLKILKTQTKEFPKI